MSGVGLMRAHERRKLECINADRHTVGPDGASWFEWKSKIQKTHDQTQCPGCGLWVIWEPKNGKQ